MLEAEVRIDAAASGWRVELNGPVGRRSQVVAPLTDADLAAIAGLVPDAKTWVGFVARLSPSAWRPDLPALQSVGRLIRDRLFGWGDAPKWLAQMEAKAISTMKPLRFVIQLDPDAAGLLAIPLELAFDGTLFVFKRRREPAVRCDPFVEWVTEAHIAKGARVLVATAHSDQEAAPTRDELSAHARAIIGAVQRAGLVAVPMPDATPAQLKDALTAGEGVDVLYVACHGVEDPRCGDRLVLRGDRGDESVTGDDLAKWAGDQAERGRPLGVALLTACSSAMPRTGRTTAGMAQWLLRRGGAHAAMGYRSPVGVSWALDFAERIFEAIAAGASFEEAFADVRWHQSDREPQWALPLLYARRWDDAPSSRPHVALRGLESALPPLRSVLPRAPRTYFTARTRELSELRAWLKEPGRAVVTAVAGDGGIGKTELATVLAIECRDAGLPVLWLERPDADLRGAALSLIRAHDPSFQPAPETSTDHLTSLARSRLRPYGGLLVLDDVAEPRGLDALQPGGAWNTIVTTRVRGLLSGVLEVTLRPLDEADAVRLLSRIAWHAEEPQEGDRAGAMALVNALGGLPLEIELAGDTLRTESLSPAEYLADLQRRAGAAAKDRQRVIAVLTRSLSFLGEDARLTLQALSVLPRAGARIDMVATTLSVREPEAARTLDRLVRHHLATFAPETGRYRLHPRVREAAREEAEVNAPRWALLHGGAGEAMDALGTWVREPMGTSSARAWERWIAVSDMFDSIDLSGWEMGMPGGDALASSLVDAEQFRHLDWSLSLRSRALDVAERLSRGSANGRRARVLQARGDLRRFQDDLPGAQKDYDDALALFVAVESRLGQANVLKARGDLRRFQDDLPGAQKDYDDALALFVAVEDRLGQANVLKARGDLRRFQDDLPGAQKDYDDALALFVAVEDRLGQANVLKARGDLRRFQDDLPGAQKDYDDALALFVAVESRLGQANVLKARGDLRRFQDDLPGAQKDYDDALALFVAVESRLGQANVLKARGNLRRFQDDLPGAQKDYDDALALFVAVEDRLGQANVLKARGDLRRFQDDLPGAQKDYDDALALFVAVESRLGQANVLQARGDLRRFQDDLPGAQKDYDDALALFVAVEDRLGQANVLKARGDLETSKNSATSALPHYHYCVTDSDRVGGGCHM